MKSDSPASRSSCFSAVVLAFATASVLGACVAASSDQGTGGASGSGGVATGTGGHGTGGMTGTGGVTGAAGAGTGGAPETGGSSGSGGGGGASGTGGSTGTGGGASGGGDGGQTAADAGSDAGGTAACPANAYFCSGFEGTSLPTGATYISSNDNNDPTKGLVFDATVFNTKFGGTRSVEVLKIASYAQRQIFVPAATTFWFRVYLRTDVAIGGAAGSQHNAFIAPIWAGEDKGVEIVEEDCELGVNINDMRYGSNGTTNQPGCPTAAPLGVQLAADTWHCIEGFFDGTKGDFTVYANGQAAVTQTGLAGAKHPFNGLRFGYRHYHERQRLVWYDDVVTAPQRIGCP